MDSCFHHFGQSVEGIALPARFTYPFHYVPHPLCVMAAAEVQTYLQQREDWKDELEQGKMFGVLVVRNGVGELGFLAAFSGILAGNNRHAYFVPPVYDLLRPDGFFKQEEARISDLNRKITALQESEEYRSACEKLDWELRHNSELLETEREKMQEAKRLRDEQRSRGISSTRENELLDESRYRKAEYKRMKERCAQREQVCRELVENMDRQIEAWKQERKQRSAVLQQKLFNQFRMLNACGEVKDLCTIFAETGRNIPPAGAGECAAPKLLQYAYQNNLYPLAMAEFWWGHSPKNEIRHHGYYYPSCKGKCEPILRHMLKGLEVDLDPVLEQAKKYNHPEIVWEDEWLLVVNKPEGVLSVPGKEQAFSVYQWMREHYPAATGPLVVHRLDMATSGLLLLAKDKDVHKQMQAQFETRKVRKRYVALLNGIVKEHEGMIHLPLCLDPLDRPRQMVNEEFGKPAVTRYEVLAYEDGCTRVAFYPLTGRTHQLRVHAAHVRGLNAPIRGDALYGQKSDRLYLHAERLEFKHPVTGKWIKVEKTAPF